MGWIFGYSAIIGGWVWALVAAVRGSRQARITLFVYALVIGLGFGAVSLLAYANFAVEYFLFGASLVTGVIASIAAGFQLLGSKGPVRLEARDGCLPSLRSGAAICRPGNPPHPLAQD